MRSPFPNVSQLLNMMRFFMKNTSPLPAWKGEIMTTATNLPETAGLTARPSLHLALLLLSGGVLIFLTFMGYSLAELGWAVFAPFLAFHHVRVQGTEPYEFHMSDRGEFILQCGTNVRPPDHAFERRHAKERSPPI